MATVNIAYSSTAQIVCAFSALITGSSRECTAIDNTTNKYLDANLHLTVTLSNGTVTGDKALNVYFYGSVDGQKYTDNATGVDAYVNLRNPTNLIGPYVISTPNNGPLTYNTVIGSVASFFGGILPQKWGFVLHNTCGVNLLTSSCTAFYSGITETVA